MLNAYIRSYLRKSKSTVNAELKYLLVYDYHYPSFSLAISANEKYKIFRMLSPNFTFSFGIAIFASPLIMVN